MPVLISAQDVSTVLLEDFPMLELSHDICTLIVRIDARDRNLSYLNLIRNTAIPTINVLGLCRPKRIFG